MNKNIAMLIVAVLLFAMALIAVNQFSSGEPDPTAPAGVTAGPEVTGQVTEQAGTVDTGNAATGNGTMPGGLMPLDNGTLRELSPAGEAGGAGTLADPRGLAGVQPGEEEGPLVDQPGLKPETHKAVPSQPAHAAKSAQKTEHKPAQKEAAKAPVKAEAPKPAKTEAVKAAPAKVEPAKKQAAAPAAKTEAAPAPKATSGGQTAKASIKFEGSTAVLHLEGASGAQYKSFVLKEPDRMVVDLVGAWTVNVPTVPSNRVIKAVRVGKPGEKTRIVLDLDKGPDGHEVVKKGGALEVRVK